MKKSLPSKHKQKRGFMTSVCPFGGGNKSSTAVCPLGFDSGTFKVGRLSCVICRALLFKPGRCLPCRHVYCSVCIGRFKDCPLCGVDITGLEEDDELQSLVDQFIQAHARFKSGSEGEEPAGVSYEDESVSRGSFLLQHAMRAFQAHNLESAKSRLQLCVDDTREALAVKGSTPSTCSQHGAVLGLLGDCLRSMGDLNGAMEVYDESVRILQDIPDKEKDTEVIHALSVSFNKLGDMKYYADDLESARKLYKQALQVRDRALGGNNTLSSQSIDVAVSLAKVADVERALGLETESTEAFTAAIKLLESLSSPSPPDPSLENRRLSVLDFVHRQMKDVHG